MSDVLHTQATVQGCTATGTELRGPVSSLSHNTVVFEVYGIQPIIRTSEVLKDFTIVVGSDTLYLGRAVVRYIIATNLAMVCEVTVTDPWLQLGGAVSRGGLLKHERRTFDHFLRGWDAMYRIKPRVKDVVTDLSGFLSALRVWTEQIEMEHLQSGADAASSLDQLAATHCRQTTPALDVFFDRLEDAALALDDSSYPLHRTFIRSQLHPLLLCSPFLHRTFFKPLGYAGDYEMVSMLIGNPFRGASLYARLINHWFVQQAPAAAHRNRLDYLLQEIRRVAANAVQDGRVARILSLGCGPAGEVERFINDHASANHVEFTLLDFNDETIRDTGNALTAAARMNHRRTVIRMEKRSVHQILKESVRNRTTSDHSRYDLVYCAGLYDYLTDEVCRRISTVLFDWTAPGGTFVATNVAATNPRRLGMDFVMDWHVIHRDRMQFLAVRPAGCAADDVSVVSENTGVNLFIEARKTLHVL